MENLFSFDQLSTFAGMVTTCTVIVQVLKQYVRLSPRWLNLIVAGILTAGVQIIAIGDTTPRGLFLSLLNWLVVTGAAGGTFDYVVQPWQKLDERQ